PTRRSSDLLVEGHGAQARDEARGKFALLRELHGLLVEGLQRLLLGLEAPSGIASDLSGGEGELDDPAAALLLPARPALARGAGLGKAFADHGTERGSRRERVGLDGDVHGHVEGRLDDVLALGEHGALEALDVLERGAR